MRTRFVSTFCMLVCVGPLFGVPTLGQIPGFTSNKPLAKKSGVEVYVRTVELGSGLGGVVAITNNSNRILNAIEIAYTFHNNFGDRIHEFGDKKFASSKSLIFQEEVAPGESKVIGAVLGEYFYGATSVRVNIKRLNFRGAAAGMGMSEDELLDLALERAARSKPRKTVAQNFTIARDIAISISDQLITTDAPPIVRDGRVMLPIGDVGRALGLKVEWSPAFIRETQREVRAVMVSLPTAARHLFVVDDTTVAIDKGEPCDERGTGFCFDAYWQMDVPLTSFSDRTYVEVRALAVLSGRVAAWDPVSRTVHIN